MPRGILLVFSDPTSAANEMEYNRWYDKTHLGEVVRVPGIVGASRFRRLMPGGANEPKEQHLAIYELEADDLGKIGDALMANAGTFDMTGPIQLDPVPTMMWFSEITPRVAQP
jgi:hypothetical protein